MKKLKEDLKKLIEIQDEMSIFVNFCDEYMRQTRNKILEIKKQQEFTYYCRYGRFPND